MRFKIPEEERKRKKREKARLRQRKCREKKKKEARDRQFTTKRNPVPLPIPPIDLPLHAIFPCVPPSNEGNCERNSRLHVTKDECQVLPASPSSPLPSNSCQPDIYTRTTPIPSVSPPPAPAITRQTLPKKRYLFSAVMPYSHSCEDYRGSPSEVHNDDDDDGFDSKVHRVTPTPARFYRPTNNEHITSVSAEGTHHPIFAVDALLSMGVEPYVCGRTGDDADTRGGGGHRLPPPPQLPPLSNHYPSGSYLSPLNCVSSTPRPSKRARAQSPCMLNANGHRSYPHESQFRSY